MNYQKWGVLALTVVVAACAGGEEAEPTVAAGPTLPPGTDVFLATLSVDAQGMPEIGALDNATNRAGYDNQPYFTPDGSGFWYTVVDDHTGQADIYRYDMEPETVAQITSTNPESEYSATPLPDGSGLSVIRVEADSLQRLWRLDADGSNGEVLLPELAPVGYHKWADDQTLVMFVLGSPATLRMGNVNTGAVETIAESVGRSIHLIPGSDDLSFVQRHEDGSSTIMRLDPMTGTVESIVDAVDGGDFHAWTPAGVLLQGNETKLFAWTADSDGWQEVADFADQRIAISRLAVSPTGGHITIVGEAN